MKSTLPALLASFSAVILAACSGPTESTGPSEPGAYVMNLGNGKAELRIIRADRTSMSVPGTWMKDGSVYQVEVAGCGALGFREQGLITYCDQCVQIKKEPDRYPDCKIAGESFPDTWISSGF
ncbi:hypothetical protein [Aromatoleum aromaticum]|uniref:hypothetical protein n=2 Tax=Aromatoleum aromaticum TaxID=551760 RepID=UPI00168EDC23|nr:hypothetical protein [Aromatoleum aromaticum]NMG56450.1 hypothetical protein [Aromatoleum aromaticum]